MNNIKYSDYNEVGLEYLEQPKEKESTPLDDEECIFPDWDHVTDY